jgi:rhomboid protease GluP
MTHSPKGSILCPNCRNLVSRSESRCPHCGISSPGAWWKNNLLMQGFRNQDTLIQTLIGINVLFYILSLFIYPIRLNLANPLMALSPNSNSLFLLGATGSIPLDQYHRWWSLISANYLHGSLLHIIFNMIALKQLTPLIIQTFGAYRMITIYTVTGMTGFFVSYLAGVDFTIGASAAICGLIGSALYYGKSRGGTYGEAIFKHVSGWLIGLFFIGLMPGINNWGHGGGILAGILIGFLLGYQEKKSEGLLEKGLAALCVLATCLALTWSLASALLYRFLGG